MPNGDMTRRAWIASAGATGMIMESGLAALGQQPAPADLATIAQRRIDGVPGLGIAIGTIEGAKTETLLRGESDGARPFDRETVFEIGSVTKTFTATLLAEMVAAHEVAVDDPIDKYLPSGVKAPTFGEHHITLLDLATQSSGLPRLPTNLAPRNPGDPYADYTAAKLYEFLSSYALTRAPGALYEYSNLGVGLLGQLLANRAGTPYPALVTKRVLAPLGMRSTGADNMGAAYSHLVPGHDADGDRVHSWSFDALAGAGMLRSSLADMLKFLGANMNGSGTIGEAMRSAQLPRRGAGTDERIGLVWMTRSGSGIIWHNGATFGFSAFVGFTGDRTRGIVILANSSDAIDDIGFHWLDPSFPLRHTYHALALDQKLLGRFTGRYLLDYSRIDPRAPSPEFAVTSKDGKLYAKLGDQPAFRIYPYAPNAFFYRIVDAQVTFTVDANGNATGLVLHQNGLDIPAKRV
jgi:CubicO group peptidase (beta-lactamase class C family)